jgi:uncharacterized RDD family membrane protein YckC
MRTCSACGSEITPGDKFCSNCGARAEPAQFPASPASESHAAMTAASDGHSAAAAAVNVRESPRAGPGGQYQGAHTAYGGPPESGSPYQQYAPAPGQETVAPPVATGYSNVPAPAAYGAPQPAAVCPNCGQAWAGTQSCAFCGQVWGVPKGIVLASAGRRLGGYLLDGLLVVVTLGIGWIIWSLIVWTQGQSPGKQLLGMRVVRLDTKAHAGWGRMFLRDIVGKFIVALVGALLLGIGAVVADCWLLWDKDKQELWDKIAGTVVVNDPDKVLAPHAGSR